MPKIVLLTVLMLAFSVSGSVILKIGAGRQGLGEVWPLSLINLHLVAAAVCYGIGLLFYSSLLKFLPLNVANSLAVLQYVGVIAASAIILAEPIGAIRWVGIAMIAAGIVTVGWTARS